MNILFYALVWGVIPIGLIILFEISRSSSEIFMIYYDANPFVQIIIVTVEALNGSLDFDWLEIDNMGLFGTTLWIIFTSMGHWIISGLFLTAAKKNFKRNF
jgi:hypothetical protein